ncbi:ORF6C domain-containing protein [Peribacillus loiseleuriae]|uniref:ORF6C domain-containing protein n=1 Tax=Peribacillus loiseleuriae TaxID=1679170 RepID=A0A0K9GS79_9BACI|nr:ORF6C domain-containing protein [Peribacillus loiseleuriae]KMY49539.1 hypothetical protein AC625_08265 [Peribacillus loiseleuriae]
MSMMLSKGEQTRLRIGVSRRVFQFTKDKKEAARLFENLFHDIKEHFGVTSYKEVDRRYLLSAIRFIENWVPKKAS